ncbi:ATP-binding SpoIIE family protein phosphatase [Kitasatospora griseola]|uniref:ATP-binding SpoIIE family protein phosphatase n=1 Tax=Kitasatospora griseola TaxID=2064 RepID=UPI00380469F3
MTLEPQGGEPEVAAFTAFLGQLFQGLSVSLTRYAARCNRDKGSVSRYFSGARIAPKDFVDELLRQVAETTGESVTSEVREHVHRLRMEALRVRNVSRHEVEELRDRLGAAERELQLAGVRERHLLRSLEATEAQAQQAEQRYRQLEVDRAAARYGTSELERWADGSDTEHAREELRALKRELDLLRAELTRAQTLRHDAEEQCVRLEARLLAAEAALATQRARHEREFKYRAELESPGAVLMREFARRVGTTVDLDTTATELCEVFVPAWADLATVYLRTSFVFGSHPEGEPSVWTVTFQVVGHAGDSVRLLGRSPRMGALLRIEPGTPAGRALKDGEPVLAVVDERLSETGPESSVLALPLMVRGREFGVLQLVRLSGRAPFESADVPLLHGLAERGALLLDSARLHQAEARLAEALQRSMIPLNPPRIAGVRSAHQYLPGDRKAGVGGDWFDVIQLAGNRVALVVGDVMGHGLEAAQTMSRLRAGVQAFALLDVPPAQLLRHLDDLVLRLGVAQLATCLYLVYDPIARRCEVASAGHVPPLLRHPDGSVDWLELPSNLPVGTGGLPFEGVTVDVPDGSMLVLGSDSLLPLRDYDGFEEFADRCADLIGPESTPDQVCEDLLDELSATARRDDLALLVVGLDGIPADRVAYYELAPSAREVRAARRFVRDRIAEWGLKVDPDIAELLAGELIADAVQVAGGPVRVRLVHTDRLLVEVTDDHHRLPVLEMVDLLDEEADRGLLMVAWRADRWGTEPRAGGRTVWFELWPRER